MKQKSGPDKAPAEQVLKDIRRQTRRHHSAEEKIRIVLGGLRGEASISLCRREGIAASIYYGRSKEFHEARKPSTRAAPPASSRKSIPDATRTAAAPIMPKPLGTAGVIGVSFTNRRSSTTTGAKAGPFFCASRNACWRALPPPTEQLLRRQPVSVRNRGYSLPINVALGDNLRLLLVPFR